MDLFQQIIKILTFTHILFPHDFRGNELLNHICFTDNTVIPRLYFSGFELALANTALSLNQLSRYYATNLKHFF